MAKRTRLEKRWEGFAPTGWLARIARDVKFGERNRLLVPSRFFWMLVLAPLIIGERTFAGLARLFTALTGLAVTDSGVQERFCDEAARFMRRAYEGINRRIWNRVGTVLKGVLARFKDLTLIDSTVLRLREFLAKKFPACRTNHTKAAAKMHTVMSLKKGQVERMLVTAETVNDSKAFEVGPWAKARLLLFDLGYFSWALFARIVKEDGYFISRLKSSCNGVVKKVRRGMRGPVGSIGLKLKECTAQGLVSDLDVEYGQGRERITLRTICIFDPLTREEHWYVTNLSPKEFSAEEIAELYRLRWQVEMLFKELKSDVAIDDLRSKREEVILCHIYAALITVMLSRFLCAEAARWTGVDIDTLVPRRVTKTLRCLASLLGKAVVTQGPRDLEQVLRLILETVAVHAAEPNPGRPGAFRKRQRQRA